jgi:hypothetical protein
VSPAKQLLAVQHAPHGQLLCVSRSLYDWARVAPTTQQRVTAVVSPRRNLLAPERGCRSLQRHISTQNGYGGWHAGCGRGGGVVGRQASGSRGSLRAVRKP